MEQLRSEGNALFSSKKFCEAIEKYTKGLDISFDNESEDIQAQRCLLWSNRAACHLQLENFREALKDCTSALEIEANNEKARYRRAQAHVGLGNLTEAFQDVRLVLQLNSSNKAAIALARKIKDIVHADAHGLQKAFESINKGFEKNECGWIRENRKQTEEALKFLEMKCFSDLSSIPAEIESKGGFTVIWHALNTLITVFSTINTNKTKDVSLITDLLVVAIGLLGVLASSSIQMAKVLYQSDKSEVLCSLISLLHEEIAKEYKSSSGGMEKNLNTAICKSIVKNLAFILKALLLDVGEPGDSTGLVHSENIRHIFEGMLNGLQSQHDVLRMSCLDGILHLLAAPPGTNDKILIDEIEISKRKGAFASIAHDMGIFQLLHSTAAAPNASDVVLSRIPLVFSQFLMQFESKEKKLNQIVMENCVQPVLKAKASDIIQLRQATASCLVLSGLFLTNAKLALWAIKQTANDGTRFLSCVHEFLLATRQTIDGLGSDESGLMQEIWMDCVASVCSLDGGTACVPAPLRLDILKLLHTSTENSIGNKSSRAKHSLLQLKASALSIQVKLSVVEKTLDVENSMESKMLLTKVFEVLEDTYEEEKQEKNTDGYVHVYVGASTPKERAIEALSYMITITDVKETFVRRSKAIASLFQLPTATSSRGHSVSSTSTHGNAPAAIVKSNVWYGLAYILYHTLSCESALKKKKMEQSGMDISPEQYEELQKALKQKSELDDGDTNEKKQLRIQRLVGTDPNEQVFATLVHLLKTSSSSNVLEMATLSALSAAEEPSVRGKMVQRGVLQALIPLSISSISSKIKSKTKKNETDKYSEITKETKISAAHAMAKILISTNPNLVSINVLLSCIKPLLELCKSESQLMQFEALMALTNIASVPTDEMKNRIAKELSTLEYLQFSEHELVRRAATESICNLLPNERVIEKNFLKNEKIRLWLAFASLEEEQEDFETSRAAAGALAMVSQSPQIGWLMMKQGAITAFARLIEQSNHEETLHRAFFALDNIVQHLMEKEDQKSSTEVNQKNDSSEEAVKEAKSIRNEYEEELSKHRDALKNRIKNIVRSNSFQETVKEAAKNCLTTLEQAAF